MSTLITAFQTTLDLLLAADNDLLSVAARLRNIKAAIERYSQDKPNSQVDDVTGDAGRYYAIATALTEWSEDFSRVVGIQYPAPTVASDETPVYLDPEDWQDDYWAGNVRYLYLPNHAPAATEKMRIQYTVPWLWTVSTTTVTVTQTAHGFSVGSYIYHDGTSYVAGDVVLATHQVTVVGSANQFTAKELQPDTPGAAFYALCYLAAGICCQALAARFAKTSDSTILADATRSTSNSAEFANRAREFMKLYQQAIGPSEEKAIEGAGGFVDWDTVPGWPTGRQFVFHERGVR
jgi:hypothetical protein